MSDLVLSLVSTGTPEHPRFLIADPQQRFWTGEGWSEKEAGGRLYVCMNTAGLAIQETLLAQHGHKPVRRFTAPVSVDLYANTDLTLDEITDWLVKVARLYIDAERHGNGPAEGTLGLCHIDWSQLQEVKTDN
jgi:hypothetical protein